MVTAAACSQGRVSERLMNVGSLATPPSLLSSPILAVGSSTNREVLPSIGDAFALECEEPSFDAQLSQKRIQIRKQNYDAINS
jgi:hypothetical protein